MPKLGIINFISEPFVIDVIPDFMLSFLKFTRGVSFVLRNYHVAQPVAPSRRLKNGRQIGWRPTKTCRPTAKEQCKIFGHSCGLPTDPCFWKSRKQGNFNSTFMLKSVFACT